MRKASALSIGIAAALVCTSAYACLNTYTQNRLIYDSDVRMLDAERLEGFIGATRPDEGEIFWFRSVQKSARKERSFENLSDLAVGLVHFGRPKDAVRLLTSMETHRPGKYQTAANLGTAHELAGDNAAALHWIREGIRRNPDAHDGTEWLHARILEAKLGRPAAAPGAPSILALDFGAGPLPSLPSTMPAGNRGKPVDVAALGLALRYQLIERTHFVEAPDPIVAGLLVDWAHLELLVGSRETATVLYEAAVRYGHPATAMLRAGLAESKRKLSAAEQAARNRNCKLCHPAARNSGSS